MERGEKPLVDVGGCRQCIPLLGASSINATTYTRPPQSVLCRCVATIRSIVYLMKIEQPHSYAINLGCLDLDGWWTPAFLDRAPPLSFGTVQVTALPVILSNAVSMRLEVHAVGTTWTSG